MLRSYDCNMQVESLLPAHLCLVTLFSSEQCSQLERFIPQHVQMVNKTSSFITQLTGNIAETSWGNRNTQTSRYKLLLCQFWVEELAPSLPFNIAESSLFFAKAMPRKQRTKLSRKTQLSVRYCYACVYAQFNCTIYVIIYIITLIAVRHILEFTRPKSEFAAV